MLYRLSSEENENFHSLRHHAIPPESKPGWPPLWPEATSPQVLSLEITGKYMFLRFFRDSLILFIFFLIHRLIVFRTLGSAMELYDQASKLRLFLAGIMSDYWTATLTGLLLTFCGQIFSLAGLKRATCSLRNTIMLIILSLVSLHCSYIAFFQHPIIPLHLSYLTDVIFLRGNISSLLEWTVAGNFFAGLAALWVGKRWDKWDKDRQGPAGSLSFASLIILSGAIIAHGLHNRYKIQWLVPETLQYNLFEGLIISLYTERKVAPLSPDEMRLLTESYLKSKKDDRTPASRLANLHLQQHRPPLSGPLAHLPARIQQASELGKKPLILLYLMESFRYYDAGIYGDPDASLTPAFDRLAAGGILFHNAWSVSNVTRGGQEAVWCGYLSAAGRSAMREGYHLPTRCIPSYRQSGLSFWMHGGDGHFDSQEWFWKEQGVHLTRSRRSLSDHLPRTGWGVGDLSLALKAAPLIQELRSGTKEKILTGMILTVTNHIPWELPDDAPPQVLNAPFPGRHLSEKTVYYADYALGRFVDLLKDLGLWKWTVMIIAGDHGIKVPALNPAFSEVSPHALGARIGLLVSGGMAESTLLASDKPNHQYQYCSQADIAGFIADLLQIRDFPSMGEGLFNTHRLKPILADFGHEIFFPETGIRIPASGSCHRSSCEKDSKEALFYRSLIEFLKLNRLSRKN